MVNDGQLFATHDSSTTWAAVGAPMANVGDVVASDSSVWVNRGFLIDSAGVLSRSDNGGITWAQVDLP